MLKTAAGPDYAYCVGLHYDVKDEVGKQLVKDGAARASKRKQASPGTSPAE